MNLESLGSTRVNIKDLILETPVKPRGLKFDPNVHITDELEDELLEFLPWESNGISSQDGSDDFVLHAERMSHLKVISPELLAATGVVDFCETRLPGEMQYQLSNFLKDTDENIDERDKFLRLASSCRILFGDRIDIAKPQEILESLAVDFQDDMVSSDPGEYFDKLIKLGLVYGFQRLSQLDQDILNRVVDDKTSAVLKERNWNTANQCIIYLAYKKMLAKKSEQMLLDDAIWDAMIWGYEDLVQRTSWDTRVDNILGLGSQLSLIQAERVWIDRSGINLIQPKPLTYPVIITLPTQRRFK